MHLLLERVIDMNAQSRKLKPGEMVALTKIPAGLLDGQREKDQAAISGIVGEPVLLSEYDDIGRAELEFKDTHGVIHFICVDPSVIKAVE